MAGRTEETEMRASTVTFGVDPGLTGAIAVLVDGVLRDVADMPAVAGTAASSKNRVQPALLADTVRDWLLRWPAQEHRCTAIIEQVNAMPKQGVSSVFSLGHSLGTAEAVFSTLGVRVEWVTPAQWKREMKLSSDKAASRAEASRLYPADSARWKRVKDDGRAEAVLLAHWFARRGDAAQ